MLYRSLRSSALLVARTRPSTAAAAPARLLSFASPRYSPAPSTPPTRPTPPSHLTPEEEAAKKLEEKNTPPPPYLAKALGVKERPTKGKPSREEWRANLLSQERRLKERKHLLDKTLHGASSLTSSLRISPSATSPPLSGAPHPPASSHAGAIKTVQIVHHLKWPSDVPRTFPLCTLMAQLGDGSSAQGQHSRAAGKAGGSTS